MLMKSMCFAALREKRVAAWLRPTIASAEQLSGALDSRDIDAAARRFDRFAPILSRLFPENGWDGRIRSQLSVFSDSEDDGVWLVKNDNALPMTGSVKARGGVHELLCIVEGIADRAGIAIDQLMTPEAQAILGRHTVVVASTGNLGYSIGVVARAIGLQAEIHMSADAKQWKKDRLHRVGAHLVEHACDYSETIARARAASASRPDAVFVDDEGSMDLLTGYAVAAREVAEQLAERDIVIDANRRLVVYLPCGVGGAPGGITYSLKRLFGDHVVAVFVEPIASPCMMVALASGDGRAHSVYEYGCDNVTIADGLAVPRASELVLSIVGNAIDAAVAVPESAMVEWVRTAWRRGGLKLEPSAAAAFAAHRAFTHSAREQRDWPDLDGAVHLFWATGGALVPEEDFRTLLDGGALCGDTR